MSPCTYCIIKGRWFSVQTTNSEQIRDIKRRAFAMQLKFTGNFPCIYMYLQLPSLCNRPLQFYVLFLYYTPEVRQGEYWGLGVFLLQYAPVGKRYKLLYENSINMKKKFGSKNKKNLRGSTQATIHPLAIILSPALWALVSMIA